MLEQLKQRLSQYHPSENPHVQDCASVLIPLFEKDHELYLLLTRRSNELRSHSGQVSFPGGKQDIQDKTPLHTALRETHEEIGLPPEKVNILGKIDQTISRHYLLVTPFVGLIPNNFKTLPNTSEIESIFSVPLQFFMNSDNHFVKEIKNIQLPFLSHHFYFKDYDIWGMTAMLILQLLEVGLGFIPKYTVHHPDAPSWMELAQNFTGEQTWNSVLSWKNKKS